MNITCSICSDLLLPHSDVFTTGCGHLFHHPCLMNWLERSKSCPECRRKTTEKTVFKIYLNTTTTDNKIDPTTLQHEVENLQFKISLKDKDIQNYSAKYAKAKNQNISLRAEVAELEAQARVHESVVSALKDQILYFKSRSKDRDKLAEEITKLKATVKNMESLQLAVIGSREEVNEMLRNENDPESLALLAATLKKALLDADKKKLNVEHKYKQLQSEVTKYRKENNSLQVTIKELRLELQQAKLDLERKGDHLMNVVKQIQKNKTESVPSPLYKRIILESPAPIAEKKPKSCDNSDDDVVIVDSPSVETKVDAILKSDSPYLPLKTCSINLEMASQKSFKLSSCVKQTSIFKRPVKTLDKMEPKRNTLDVVYNGLGGHSKIEVFPSPKTPTGSKRRRPEYSSSSTKFRKVAPTVKK